MKTVPVFGTLQPVRFYEDDSIETVRQIVALHVASHPRRTCLKTITRRIQFIGPICFCVCRWTESESRKTD